MPTTPRLWVPIKSGIRPETDAEYLVRLRERAREKRRADQPQSTLGTPPPPAAVSFERSLRRRVPIGFVSDLVDAVDQFFAALPGASEQICCSAGDTAFKCGQ